MTIIQTQQLSKTFYKGASNEVRAVKEATLSIEAGSCVLLQGSSGSGKTTLLTLLSCLARPSSGDYQCLGEEVSRWSEKFLTSFRQAHIGIVFQHFNLVHGFSVMHNISLPLWPLGYSAKVMEEKASYAAEQVNISHRLHFAVDKLSGGELQRVAIARALVSQPKLLFADEPTAHLDGENSESILTVFSQLKAQGTTLVITTHDPVVTNHPMVDHTIQMKDGEIV